VISCTCIYYGKMTQDEVGGLLGPSYNQKICSAIWAYQEDGVALRVTAGKNR
jgi:hypothetical protein